MDISSLKRMLLLCALACLSSAGICAETPIPTHVPADAIPKEHLLQPANLARTLKSGGKRPLILQVGSHVLYTQAHVPGSEYVGAAAQDAGLAALQSRVDKLDRAKPIVIYCGCCPWSRCPNIGRAWEKLKAMGFTKVEAVYIADDFGADWVDKGYPVETGG